MPGSGFPNAAEEAGTEPLNLHKLIVKSPASTFFMRLDSDSHREMGLYKNDVLVIDRSLEMRSGDLVVVHMDGDFLLKQYRAGVNQPQLVGGPNEEPITLGVSQPAQIWGVVSYAVHDYRGAAQL